MTITGELAIRTTWDLGGLGSREGPPTMIHWTSWGVLPPLLPWLGMVALLANKSNRRASVWWIFLPLACTAIPVALGLEAIQRVPFPKSLPVLKHLAEALCDVPFAVAMAMAALWLAASRLDFSSRVGAVVRVVVVLAGVSGFTYMTTGLWRQGFNEAFESVLFLPVLLALDFGVALILCGFACRGRYGPVRVVVWFGLSVAVVSLAIATPVSAVLIGVWPEQMKLQELQSSVVPLGTMIAVGVLAMALPFLVLAICNSVFRERIKGMLGVV